MLMLPVRCASVCGDPAAHSRHRRRLWEAPGERPSRAAVFRAARAFTACPSHAAAARAEPDSPTWFCIWPCMPDCACACVSAMQGPASWRRPVQCEPRLARAAARARAHSGGRALPGRPARHPPPRAPGRSRRRSGRPPPPATGSSAWTPRRCPGTAARAAPRPRAPPGFGGARQSDLRTHLSSSGRARQGKSRTHLGTAHLTAPQLQVH